MFYQDGTDSPGLLNQFGALRRPWYARDVLCVDPLAGLSLRDALRTPGTGVAAGATIRRSAARRLRSIGAVHDELIVNENVCVRVGLEDGRLELKAFVVAEVCHVARPAGVGPAFHVVCVAEMLYMAGGALLDLFFYGRAHHAAAGLA